MLFYIKYLVIYDNIYLFIEKFCDMALHFFAK